MRIIVIASALLLACASAGDSGGGGGTGPSARSPEPGRPDLPLVTDSDSAKASAGKAVRVRGTALNAKLGPVVSTGGLVIYCFGKQEWRADEVGRPVSVTGTLEKTDEFKAEEDADGALTAGTGGGDWVIRQCTVEAP